MYSSGFQFFQPKMIRETSPLNWRRALTKVDLLDEGAKRHERNAMLSNHFQLPI